MTALERLNLPDNRIADLWPLAGLTGLNGLEVLLLDGNRVTDVRALAQIGYQADWCDLHAKRSVSDER